MRKLAIVAALILSGCATAGDMERPSLWTNPNSYVENFPLSVVSSSELVRQMGAPDHTITVDGAEHWTYRLGGPPGNVRYTYTLKDGKVIDVTYNAAGSPANGVSARARQAK